jgi:hypothetical protein
MTTAWDHLPNKIHIDQVFIDLTNHQDLFVSAWQQARGQPREQAYKQAYKQAHVQARIQVWKQARSQVYEQTREQVLAQVCDQARIQVWKQARSQVYEQTRDHAWEQTLSRAYDTAGHALLALITYDDASKYLTMPADQAMVYGELVFDNQYILLKPYLLVQKEIALLATA